MAEKTPTQHRTHATTTEGPPFGDVTTKKHKIFTTQKLKTTTIVGSPATELSKTQNKTTEKDRTKKINFSTTRGLPLEESTQPLDVEETPSSSGYGRKTTRQTTREISSTLYYGEEETSKHSSTQITHKNKLDFFTKEPYPTEKPETHTKGELETSTTSQIEISTPVEEYGKRTTKKTTDDISSTSQYEDSTTKEQTVEYNRKTTFKSGSSSHKPHQSTTTQTEPSTTENVDESEYSTPQYGSLETSTNQQPSTTRGNNIKTTTSKNRFESTTVQKTYKPSYTTASTTLEDLEITNPLSTPNNINDQKTTKESYEDISSTPQYGEEKPSTRSSTRTTHENNLDFSTKEHEASTTYELETSTIYHKKISTPAQGYGRRTTEQASDNISSTLQNEDSKTEKQTADYNRRTTSHEPHHSTTTQTEPSTTEEVDESEYSTPQYGSLETSTKPPRFGSTSEKQTHKYSSSTLEDLENTQSSSEPTHDYGKKTTEQETLPPFDEETTTSESSSRHSSPTSFSQTSTHGLPYEGSTLPLDDEETPSNSGYGRRTTRQSTQGLSSTRKNEKDDVSSTHFQTRSTHGNKFDFFTDEPYSTNKSETLTEDELETSTISHVELSTPVERYGRKTTKKTTDDISSTSQYEDSSTKKQTVEYNRRTTSRHGPSSHKPHLSTTTKTEPSTTEEVDEPEYSTPQYGSLETSTKPPRFGSTSKKQTHKYSSSTLEDLENTQSSSEPTHDYGKKTTEQETLPPFDEETTTSESSSRHSSPTSFSQTSTHGLPYEGSTLPLDDEETPSNSGYGRRTTRQSTQGLSSTRKNEKDDVSSTHFQTRSTHGNKFDFFTDEPYSTNESETLTEDELETSTISHVELSTPVERYGRKTTKKTTDDISSTSQYEDSSTKKQTVEYNRRTTSRHGPSSHKPHLSTTTKTEPSTTEEVDEPEYSTPQYGSLETSTKPPRFGSTSKKQTHKYSSSTLEDLENTQSSSEPTHDYGKKTTEQETLPPFDEETTTSESSSRHSSPTSFSQTSTYGLPYEGSTLPLDDEETPSNSGYGRRITRQSTQELSSTRKNEIDEVSSTHFQTRSTHGNSLDFSTKEHEASTTYELETSTISHNKFSTPAQGYGRRTTEQASDNISSTLQNEDSKTEKQTADYNRRTTSHEPHHSTTTQTEPSTTEEVDESEYSTPQYGSLETSTTPPRFGSTSKKQTHKYSSSILEALENTQSSSEPTHDYGKKTTEKETLPPFDEETTTSESSSRHSSPTSFSQTSTYGLPYEGSTLPLDDEETPSNSGYGRRTTRQSTQELSSTRKNEIDEVSSTHFQTRSTHGNSLDFSTKEHEASTTYELETSTISHNKFSTPAQGYGRRTTEQASDNISSTLQNEDSKTEKQTADYNRRTTSHEPHHSTTTQTEPSTTEEVDESEYSTPQYGSLETSTKPPRFGSTSEKQTHKYSSSTLEDLENTQSSSEPTHDYGKKTTEKETLPPFDEETTTSESSSRHSSPTSFSQTSTYGLPYEGSTLPLDDEETPSNSGYGRRTTRQSTQELSSTRKNEIDEVSSTHFQTRSTHGNSLDFSTKEHEASTTYELETSTISHNKFSTPAQGYGRRTTEQASDNISSTLQNEDSTTEKQTADYNRRTTSHEPHHSTTTQTEPSTTEEVDESEYSTPQYGSLETSTKPPRFGSTSKKQTHKYSSSTLEDLENTQSSSEPTHDYGKKTTEKETLPPFDEETTTSESSSRHSSPTSFSQTSTYGLPYEGSTLPLDDEETPSNSGYGRRTTRQTTQGFSSASQFDKEKTSAHSSTGSITGILSNVSTSASSTSKI